MQARQEATPTRADVRDAELPTVSVSSSWVIHILIGHNLVILYTTVRVLVAVWYVDFTLCVVCIPCIPNL